MGQYLGTGCDLGSKYVFHIEHIVSILRFFLKIIFYINGWKYVWGSWQHFFYLNEMIDVK